MTRVLGVLTGSITLIGTTIVIVRWCEAHPTASGHVVTWVAVVPTLLCAVIVAVQAMRSRDWKQGIPLFVFLLAGSAFTYWWVRPSPWIGAGSVLVVYVYSAAFIIYKRENAKHKTCPECAETVKSAAKICRYCLYRFEPLEEPAPQLNAEA